VTYDTVEQETNFIFSDKDKTRFQKHYIEGLPDECWEWTGVLSDKGYGDFGLSDNNIQRAHRISFFLKNGYLTEDVHHKCLNPACVNPFHLQGMTHVEHTSLHNKGRIHTKEACENMSKGKIGLQVGEKNPFSKNSDDDRRQMFILDKEGFSQRKIAEIMNVNQSTVGRTLSGKLAPHIWKEFN
jgi:hypothetical protein